MNRFNKNIFHRTICIFLLITLCMGLCFEATALPVTMKVGRFYDLGEGYSIRVVQIDLEGEKAQFELSKKGKGIASEIAHEGGSFNLNDDEIFHFAASFYVVDKTTVGLCFEEAASGKSGKKTLAGGANWELIRGYSVRVVKVDLEGNKAEVVLNKGGKVVDKMNVNDGDWFILVDDGANFHFGATVDAVFRGTDANIVQLKPFSWKWWMAVGEPHDLQASAGDGYVDLEWAVPDTDCGSPIEKYQIYRGTSSGDESYLASVNTSEISYKDTAVTNGQTYHYYVTAVNDGESSPSSEASAKPQGPPSPPQNLHATTGDEYVNLSWIAPDDDGGSLIKGYMIYRGNVSGGEKTRVGTVGDVVQAYTDESVINNQTYYYQVSAVNFAGFEGKGSHDAKATPTSGVTVPSDPPELKATGGNHEVKLEWKKPEDDGGAPITEYRIYRSMKLGDKKINLVTVGDVRTYNDENLKNGQTYYYQVSAVNSAGFKGRRSHDAKAIPKPDWAFIAVLIGAAAAIIAAIITYLPSRKRRYGSVSVTSRPDGARVFLDGVDKGESPVTLDKIRKGTRIVLFSKSGYSDCEKRVVVNADQITPVQCDLKKPEMKLRLSAEPAEIHADGKSKSVITIGVEYENGTPAPVPKDTEIVLETNIGLIDTPVKIRAGDVQARSILTSSTAGGTATVRAKSETGLKSSVAVRFV